MDAVDVKINPSPKPKKETIVPINRRTLRQKIRSYTKSPLSLILFILVLSLIHICHLGQLSAQSAPFVPGLSTSAKLPDARFPSLLQYGKLARPVLSLIHI